MTPESHKLVNRDIQAFGREQQEKELSDRSVFLRTRIKHIETDLKEKSLILNQLRAEFDALQTARGLKSQTKLF